MEEVKIELSKEIIFRDDDISCATKVQELAFVQDIFDKYKVRHTIALIAKDIEKAPELIKFIRSKDIDVQIHCYEHIDYSLEENVQFILSHLEESKAIITKYFDNIPTIVYPPWNNSCNALEEIAHSLNLEVSTEKLSLQAYIRAGGGVKEKVVNFHYHASAEVMHLELALKLYIERKSKCV